MVGHARGPEIDNTKKHLTPPPSPNNEISSRPNLLVKKKKERIYPANV